MPTCFQRAAAASRPACGFTWSRSEAVVGSDRMTVPWIQAGAVDPRAMSSAAMTMAQAPSDDGHVSSYRIGSHSIVEERTSSTDLASRRCAYGFFSAFVRSLAATMAPISVGALERRMYERTCGAK